MSIKELEKRVDASESAIGLIKNDFSYMKKGIDEIKKSIEDLGMSMNNGYVTKEQFERLRDDVDEMKNLKGWAIKIVIGAVILALLSLVLIKV